MRYGKKHSKEYFKGTRRHADYRFPLNAFLHSKLGQPWSIVHAQLSQDFDRRTYVGHKFWKSMRGYWYPDVAERCWIGAETKKIYDSMGKEIDGFYVHPFTGTLEYQKIKVEKKTKEKEIIHIDLKDGSALDKIEGIWYHVKYVPNPYYYGSYSYPKEDTVMDRTSSRQLNSKELKLSNLVNTPYEWKRKMCAVCLLFAGSKRLEICKYDEEFDDWVCYADQKDYQRRSLAKAEQWRRKNK